MAAREVVAFVLMRVEAGKEVEVLNEVLNKFRDSVTEARITYGEYDIVVRVVAANMRALEAVISGIRRLNGVVHTVTLIAV